MLTYKISGLGFFSLPHTRLWRLCLLADIIGSLGLVIFMTATVIYDGSDDYEAPYMVPLLICSALGVLCYLSVVSWVSSMLLRYVQLHRGYHSVLLRVNSIYTAFVGLLYSLEILLTIGSPLITFEEFTVPGVIKTIPLVLMIVLKLYIALRLSHRQLPKLGSAIMVFWLMVVITAAEMVIHSCINVLHGVDAASVIIAVLTSVAGINMLFRYSQSTIEMTGFPCEYMYNLER